MRAPTLSIARLTVDILIRSIAGDNRIQCLCAVVALVTLSMPITSLGDDQLCGKDHATASRAARSRLSLNL